MVKLLPATDFLYLHDAALDLYLRPLREMIGDLPEGVLKLDPHCRPVIVDFMVSDKQLPSIALGYGFHHRHFYRYGSSSDRPSGLAFCLDPPFLGDGAGLKDIVMFQRNRGWDSCSSFVIGRDRFFLTDRVFDLDTVVCGELKTGERYKPSKEYL